MLNPRLDRRLPTRPAMIGVAAAVALLVLPVAILRGAQAARQPLDGVVYDTTGAVMPGVAVTLDAGPSKLETTTDPAGRFRFDGVDPGSHVIQVAVPGFRELRQPLELRHDGDWNRSVTLQIGDVRESISVRERRPASITPIGDTGGSPTPVRVGGNIRAPRKLVDQNPVYPKRMVDAGLEGKVSVEAVIGVDGRVVPGPCDHRPGPPRPRPGGRRCGAAVAVRADLAERRAGRSRDDGDRRLQPRVAPASIG